MLSGTFPNTNENTEMASKYKEYKEIVEDPSISLDETDSTEEQKLKLLKSNATICHSFAKDISELGSINVHKHKIETGTAPPQCICPYRVSPQIKQHIDEQTEDALKHDIIEPSDSLWAAPV